MTIQRDQILRLAHAVADAQVEWQLAVTAMAKATVMAEAEHKRLLEAQGDLSVALGYTSFMRDVNLILLCEGSGATP